jgi:hypothetical protein
MAPLILRRRQHSIGKATTSRASKDYIQHFVISRGNYPKR